MGTKKIKFNYFRPCLSNATDESVDLSPYFKKLLSMPDLYNLEIKSNNSTVLTPTFLKEEIQYNIREGATLQYTLWRFDLSKYRLDLPSVYDKKQRKLTNFESSKDKFKDKFISEETVCLYDHDLNIIVIQSNQNGPSAIQVQGFINNFIDNDSNKVVFVPLIYKQAFERSLKQSKSHSIHVRLINTRTEEFKNYTNSTEDETVRHAAEMASSLRGSEEYDVKVDFTISINKRKPNQGFVKDKITSAISSFFPMIDLKMIDQFSVKGYNENETKVSTINLIKDVIFDEYGFDFDENHRTISTINIFNQIAILYNSRRKNLIINNKG
ncbi:MAG: hypothetical protein K6F01_12835 [Selenomonas sp.]|uniref:DUF6731 family protein n=1 Tax=Selenomonas sp. TaxID=2053611 RepID=UPI0025EF9383|nr:DUF6731 family protein [Selenomonas sp.]MCR5440302.1 hypothetical protein [Selenomonas sp.]